MIFSWSSGITVGEYAFSGSGITSFTVNSVSQPSAGMFKDCKKLATFSVGSFSQGGDTVPDEIFMNCGVLSTFNWPVKTVRSVGASAFEGCSLVDPSFSYSSTTAIEIGAHAFSGSGITRFDAETIDQPSVGMFKDCDKLESFSVSSFSQGGDAVPAEIFVHCSRLRIFTWPKTPRGVTEIGKSAFQGCSMLNPSLEYSTSGAISVDDYAFSGSGLAEFNPTGRAKLHLGRGVFSECHELKTCDLSNSDLDTQKFAPRLFFGCTKLEHLTLPDNGPIRLVGYSSFYGCSSLDISNLGLSEARGLRLFADKKLEFGEEVTFEFGALSNSGITRLDLRHVKRLSLGESAFSNCQRLLTILLPETLDHLPDFVFAGCSRVVDVTIPQSVQSFGRGCFENCASLASVTYMGTAQPPSDTFAGCSALKSVTVNDDNHDGCYFGGFQRKPCSLIEKSPGGFAGVMIAVLVVIAAGILVFLGVTGQLKCKKLEQVPEEPPETEL